MRKGRLWLLLSAAASATVLAGCASGIGPGVQIGVTTGPGLQGEALSCAVLGNQVQRLSGMPRFMEFANHQMRVARRKAMNAIPTPHERMQGWKRLSSGDC